MRIFLRASSLASISALTVGKLALPSSTLPSEERALLTLLVWRITSPSALDDMLGLAPLAVFQLWIEAELNPELTLVLRPDRAEPYNKIFVIKKDQIFSVRDLDSEKK